MFLWRNPGNLKNKVSDRQTFYKIKAAFLLKTFCFFLAWCLQVRRLPAVICDENEPPAGETEGKKSKLFILKSTFAWPFSNYFYVLGILFSTIKRKKKSEAERRSTSWFWCTSIKSEVNHRSSCLKTKVPEMLNSFCHQQRFFSSPCSARCAEVNGRVSRFCSRDAQRSGFERVHTQISSDGESLLILFFHFLFLVVQIPDEVHVCASGRLPVPEHHPEVTLVVAAENLHFFLCVCDFRWTLMNLNVQAKTWRQKSRIHQENTLSK